MSSKKTTKTPEPEPSPDWEAIEREYRAGQLSIRQIARQQGVTERTLRRRATKYHWKRDLAEAVRQEVQATLVRTEHPTHLTAADEAIITFAAARGVEVIRQHRDHLARLQRIATRLAEKLEIVLSESDPEVQQRARSILGFKESPSDVLNKIAQATARWMPLEREAFGLDHRPASEEGDAPKPVTPGIDWRDLFAKAGIIEASADGGTGGAAPQSELSGGVTALPSD